MSMYSMDRDTLLCKCRNIRYGEVLDAVNKSGASNYQEAFELLHFGVGCGGCRSRIKRMIYFLNIEKQQNRAAGTTDTN